MAGELRVFRQPVLVGKFRLPVNERERVFRELPADELHRIAAATANPKERLQMLAQAIDRCIHSNYAIYNVNRIAYDLLHGEARFAGEYTDSERSDFEQYVSRQVARVDIAQRDSLFLRTKILEMYANPLANYLQAQGL